MRASLRACLWHVLIAVALCGAVGKPVQGAMYLTQDIVDNGSIAYAANFPTLGAIYVFTEQGYISGSGTLAVKDNIVVTAAHLFDGLDGIGGGITSVQFFLGSNVYSATHSAFGSSWVSHPGYAPNGKLFGNNDLAVLKLDRSFTHIDPTDLFTGTLTTGMSVSMGGFGLTGTNGTGYLPFDGSKRAGTNVIEGFGGIGQYGQWDQNFVFTDFDGPFSGPTDLEVQGGSGDSGGFLLAADGSLAGVLSFVTGPQTPGSFLTQSTGAINLSNYHPWLNETITTMTVPEPSSFMLAGSAAIVLGIYRFRRLRQRTRSPKGAV